MFAQKFLLSIATMMICLAATSCGAARNPHVAEFVAGPNNSKIELKYRVSSSTLKADDLELLNNCIRNIKSSIAKFVSTVTEAGLNNEALNREIQMLQDSMEFEGKALAKSKTFTDNEEQANRISDAVYFFFAVVRSFPSTQEEIGGMEGKKFSLGKLLEYLDLLEEIFTKKAESNWKIAIHSISINGQPLQGFLEMQLDFFTKMGLDKATEGIYNAVRQFYKQMN